MCTVVVCQYRRGEKQGKGREERGAGGAEGWRRRRRVREGDRKMETQERRGDTERREEEGKRERERKERSRAGG